MDISLTFFGVFYIAFLLSFIVFTRNLNNGFFFVWLIFIGAFSTDTMAYFAGRFFGKHKLMPLLALKKQ
ncbi:phosphatidate cytidylyltransferase [Acetivibrio straminisolvens JCM 21531]|uniref:Phosphatidate cytidylyltransferase n=1 Tax=Acetivibrio straminisolvens JCM 21531 TaxID=1294263 RepID=W4V2S1_9FIRM|nr:phosphatidate cytidylyltransferase [Acetivibrio straminisolvens JCM 21531]